MYRPGAGNHDILKETNSMYLSYVTPFSMPALHEKTLPPPRSHKWKTRLTPIRPFLLVKKNLVGHSFKTPGTANGLDRNLRTPNGRHAGLGSFGHFAVSFSSYDYR